MPPNPQPSGPVRSAAAVNEAIRALWSRSDPRVQLAGEQRAEYERLCVEWAAAMRAEITTAA